MLVDRGADGLGVAGGAGVLGADVALEVRELAHELGGLVGLAEASGLAGGVAAAEPLDEPHEPLGLVGERACALEEGDRAEPAASCSIPDGEVALEREGRVVEPALEHALVAADHERRIAAVGDEGEAGAREREVALVGLHRRLDHPRRQREEALVEAALQHDRALDEVDDLVELPERVAPAFGQPRDDLPPALGRVRLDAVRPQRLGVALRRTGSRSVPR